MSSDYRVGMRIGHERKTRDIELLVLFESIGRNDFQIPDHLNGSLFDAFLF